MVNLLDLPEEILEIIFKYLVKSAYQYLQSHSPHISASVAAQLRLVCRKWSNWLYVHHLYNALTFNDSSQSIKFINYYINRSPNLLRPRCQLLRVGDLSHQGLVDSRSLTSCEDPDSFEMLETLIGFFSETIVELDLSFVNILSIPSRTLDLIRRIENLRTLRLALSPKLIRGNDQLEINLKPNPSPLDTNSFLCLILAAQGLNSLDLTDLPAHYLPTTFPPSLNGSQLPMITQLEIKLADHQPLDSIINLSIAIKSSLKVLSIKSFREDGQQLLPIFEHLQDTLEGLFVTHERTLTPIYNFKFPKLRVFRIYYWDDCIADFLCQDMFSTAPIQVIALYSHTVYRRKRKFLVDPFAKLSKLRRLAFLHARLDDSPPQNYLSTCRAHKVECVYLDHSDISSIMKL